MLTNENRSVHSISNRVLSWRSKYLHYTPFLHVSKCCVRDSNMIYGPWNGNISNFTWRVPWSRCIPSIHPQNMSTYLYGEKTSDQWKLKGSNWIMFVAISRTDCDFSVHTNSLHIESARSQPWFIDSENEWKKKENQREKPKTLLTMKKS